MRESFNVSSKNDSADDRELIDQEVYGKEKRMAAVKPFCCIRPTTGNAGEVAALPYDVYDRAEARREVEKHPLSFLGIDRAETGFPDSVGMYEPCVYERARALFEQRLEAGILIEETSPAFYLYELTRNGRVQTGLVACCAVDDYLSGGIRKHENTRPEKEQDRICHIDTLDAQTGPIFLAYRPEKRLRELVQDAKKEEPLYDFVTDDGIRHRVWKAAGQETLDEIRRGFGKLPAVYIADGHHRAASAVKVALKRRQEYPEAGPEAEFNSFLCVLFPSDELQILPYHRVVRDLNGYSVEEFLHLLSENFTVRKVGRTPFSPSEKGHFGMYLQENWYELQIRPERIPDDPVGCLDAALLQDYLLSLVLGIHDPTTDKRIDFIGGVRGLTDLERRVSEDMQIAFSMYPTSMEELLEVADAGRLMPPKSTWFEPKLRSGLFIHRLGGKSGSSDRF